ncbi:MULTISPECIES: DMT family transporter [Metabacillus]|uniref:DMT family transporter n=1 Tax=Metabacillus hrfriensis TaxID=3048891 RepID=A0ACD4R5I7_9BACI|nr:MULTISPECIES: DMT family transporter [Metabacillus]UAL50241.1 DMT family transporter [Metabacillus dongyingensis]UOK56352.1 DMT family transporter [Bacillus sp. OVS6]USK26483.1 DMT family transporter [Bacillus sp. CMF21]WHZ55708.1 DMT family transporter [Metabacillus sp. CT-WN-B3]
MYNLISAAVGAFIAIMIVLNGELSNGIGNYTSSVAIHLVGLLAICAVFLFIKKPIHFQKGLPLYLYSAGAIGVLTVLFSNISFMSLGVSVTIALGLLGQSLAAIIIDHYGLLGMKTVKFNKTKCIGLAFILLGSAVMTFY